MLRGDPKTPLFQQRLISLTRRHRRASREGTDTWPTKASIPPPASSSKPSMM
jgi:hypothetical protein